MKRLIRSRAFLPLVISFSMAYPIIGRTQATQQDRVEEILVKSIQASQTVDDSLIRAMALVRISAGYAKTGRKDKASELLSSAFELVKVYVPKPSLEIAVKELALGSIALAYADIGQQDRAKQALSLAAQSPLMKAPDSRKAQYSAQIAAWYMKAGQKARAVDMLRQAFKLARTVKDSTSSSISLGHIAGSAAEAGERELALEIARSIEDGPFKADALSKIAISYAESGQYDKASEVANTIQEIAFIPEVLIVIADKYAEAGKQDKADKLLAQASAASKSKGFPSLRRRSVQRGLSLAYAKAGQIDRALNIALEDWPKYLPDMESLGEIALHYIKAGQGNDGEQVLSQMDEILQSFDSAEYKAKGLANIARVHIESGQKDKGLDLLSEALRICDSEKESFQREPVLIEITMSYVAAKEYDQALTVAERLDAYARATALAAIAIKYSETNSPR